MTDVFVRKLERGTVFSPADRDLLTGAVTNVRCFRAGEDVSSQGDVPRDVHIVLEGWGCRYKLLEDGSRQIMAILLPGDMCDLHVQILREMDHGISVLTDARIGEIPPDRINALTRNPRLALALNWATLVDEGTLREWLVNLGQRPADQRMAHLICELFTRLGAVGLADDDGFDLMLTQTQLADVTGMSAVHVNRTLMTLRREGLIVTSGRHVHIPHLERLEDFGGFDPAYLHLDGAQPGARA